VLLISLPVAGIRKLSFALKIVHLCTAFWAISLTPHEAYTYHLVVAHGKRKKTDTDDKIPCIFEPELTDKAFGRNWARFIQKNCEANPLVCSKCSGAMRVIAFIEDPDVIKGKMLVKERKLLTIDLKEIMEAVDAIRQRITE
jgi:hypothetical protein